RDVLPTAAVERLEKRGQAGVVDDRLPVERKLKIAQAVADDAFDVVLLGQQHRLRNCDAELLAERVVEKLVVSGPPERITYDVRAFEHHPLQRGAIEGNFVRNAI